MSRGPKVTTGRGRAAGGLELRVWASAEEYAEIEAAAAAEGVKPGAYARDAALKKARRKKKARKGEEDK